MFPSSLARLLHIGSLLLFFTGIIFVSIALIGRYGAFRSEYHVVQRTRPLLWRTLQEHLLPDEPNNRTNPTDFNCRNSVQGSVLLVDERGFVCQREHMLHNGCCNVEIPDTKYYTCDTCNANTHCCSIYEYCVSCCLHPSKRPLLELVLNTTTGQRYLFASVVDQFELCLFKCRTNSHSVEHENKYRNELAKYCYGKTEPHESQRDVTSSAVQ